MPRRSFKFNLCPAREMLFLCCSPILPALLILGIYIIMGVPPPFLQFHLAVAAIPAGQVSSYKPYTYFASAAYCSANTTKSWSCVSCQANSDFKPVAAGGYGTSVQYWFVGYSPSLRSVIVAHQGTSTKSILPILTDVMFAQESLNATLFSGMDSEIRVHSGFAGEHVKSASAVLAAVNSMLDTFNTSSVTVTGHSLGAALALLDSVYLSLHLPVSTNFTTITYGLPRVGNKNFADYVDAHNLSLTRITNKKDPIPVVPEQVLGYEHPSGEIHITTPVNGILVLDRTTGTLFAPSGRLRMSSKGSCRITMVVVTVCGYVRHVEGLAASLISFPP